MKGRAGGLWPGLCGAWFCACTLSPGNWLATVVPGTVSARLGAPADRFTSDGWLLTDQGFALQLDSVTLNAQALQLFGSMAAGPPDGQAPDGASGPGDVLVSLGLGASLPVTVTRTPAPSLAGVPLTGCSPGCGLGPGELDGATLTLGLLQMQGSARDDSGAGRLPGATPFRADLSLPPPGSFLGAAQVNSSGPPLPLDRATPAELPVSALLVLSPALGDGIDWSALGQQDGTLCLGDQGPPGCAAGGAAVQLQGDLTRSTLALDLTAQAGTGQ